MARTSADSSRPLRTLPVKAAVQVPSLLLLTLLLPQLPAQLWDPL